MMNNSIITDIEQLSPRLLDPTGYKWCTVRLSASPGYVLKKVMQESYGHRAINLTDVYKRIALPFKKFAMYVNLGGENTGESIIKSRLVLLADEVMPITEKKGLSVQVFERGGPFPAIHNSWRNMASVHLNENGQVFDTKNKGKLEEFGSYMTKDPKRISAITGHSVDVAKKYVEGLRYEARNIQQTSDLSENASWHMAFLTRAIIDALLTATVASENASLKIYLPAKVAGKDKVNKARKKKNLQPMLRWTERVFEPQIVRVGGEPKKGGTHASPAYHERIAHWRHRAWEDMGNVPDGWEVAAARPGYIRRRIPSTVVNLRFKDIKATFHDYTVKEAA